MTAYQDLDSLIAAHLDQAGVPRESAQAGGQALEMENKLAAVSKSREKWKGEAQRQRERADRQAEKAEAAKKEARAARGEFKTYQQELKQKREAAKKKVDQDYKTIKSDDGSVHIQIAHGQIHLHMPHYCWVISSKPMKDEADAIPKFDMRVLKPILAEDPHGEWIRQALAGMGRLWRRDNDRVRMDDLDLTKQVLSKLDKAGFTFVSEAKATDLASLPGIGPATVKAINAAIRKGPIDVPGEPKK